jgi:molecular chaperone DnaK
MVQARVKEFFGREPHKGVNPDEVVALGAAVQAGVLGGEVKDILLLDVTPLSLGLETLGGVMTTLIARNTTVPTKKSEVFSTASDNQPSVEIHVLQGERQMARDNRTLGRFHLDGIPPAPRGTPQIEVSFDIDANGIVHVHAKDKATGRENKIRIEASSGLNENDIKRMVDDAKQHESEDKQRKETVEERNKLDSLVYNTEKLLNENKDKVPEAQRSTITEAVERGKKALAGEDVAEIKAAAEALTQASHKLAEVMYQAASAGGAGGPMPGAGAGPSAGGGQPETPPPGKEGVIDAEFEESRGGNNT